MNSRRLTLTLTLAVGLVLTVALIMGLENIPVQAQGAIYPSQAKPTQAIQVKKMSVQQIFNPTWAAERVDAEKTFGKMTDRSMVLDDANHPHIAYGQDHLYYAYYDGSTWYKETVDPAWGVGLGASIALDDSGNPHISYHDDINDDLKYARYDGSQWLIETVDSNGDVGIYTSIALDDDDHPHIGYYDNTNVGLKYAHYDGNTWHVETVDSNVWIYEHLSLDVDSTGYPHIGYAWKKWPNLDELRYARWTGSVWLTETVDSGDVLGQFTSLALDSSNRPHISYLDGGNEVLMYAHWTGSVWMTDTVDSTVGWGYVKNSIDLDTSDDPYIAYTNPSSGYLVYALWTGSGWITETVNGNETGSQPSLALDNTGNPHISYIYNKDDLKYAFWAGSVWNIQAVDSKRDLGRFTSLALAPTAPYTPHISYAGSGLKYAYYNGSIWMMETIDSEGGWGGTSLALAQTAPYTPCIAYYDTTNTNLKYAHWTDSGWVAETVTSLGDTGWGIALALAPTAPYTPHIAYIDEADLKYAHWTGSGWTVETVDYGTSWWWTLDSPSLALVATDPYTPFVSYHDTNGGHVRFARRTGSGWVTETVAYAMGGTAYTSLAVDSVGNPHIAYNEWSNADLKYASWTGAVWTVETVARSGEPSLVLDSNDQPQISFYAGGDLYHAYFDDSMWVTETVDSLGDVGGSVSLALDGGGRPRIAYYDNSNGDLKFAWQGRVDIVPLSGGMVGAYGLANLEFPGGTFTDTVVLTYTVLQPSASQSHVGVFFDLSAVYASTGEAAQIVPGQTYTVVVYYDEANVPSDVNESDLALYYWNSASSKWVKEPSSMVDTVNNTITATPNHFSVWAGLFEETDVQAAISIEKSVFPKGQVNYGEELTYTLVISTEIGTQVGIYDLLEGTTFERFVQPTTGITHTNDIITGTLTMTPTSQITVSFVVEVGIPGTAGWTVSVTNTACAYPINGTIENDCIWSEEVINTAFQPYSIYLPLTLRDS